MRLPIVVLAAALALAAGCDNKGSEKAAPAPRADSPPPQTQATTPTTPANIGGQPKSAEEKKEGTNPVQGQVDPKQSEQHRDFQQKGDAKGPTSPDTKPKGGS